MIFNEFCMYIYIYMYADMQTSCKVVLFAAFCSKIYIKEIRSFSFYFFFSFFPSLLHSFSISSLLSFFFDALLTVCPWSYLPHAQDVMSRFYSTLAYIQMDKGHTAVWIKGNPGEDEQGSAGKDANFLAGLRIRPDFKML